MKGINRGLPLQRGDKVVVDGVALAFILEVDDDRCCVEYSKGMNYTEWIKLERVKIYEYAAERNSR